ncbi:LysR substrate-binding domain-containing protein [Opitutus sp. ER46]|uniref:LysR substrate-binding domain-containing protein n=1 Tax=Opitutus sp. ER46 TaxID=2161864 RepID=UPI00130486ED|nr:LysR substrate-binding domain-containing protein [Opitutus sp. ER46]
MRQSVSLSSPENARERGMDLRRLRYFVAVASTLNFRAAAEGLHISAPALSKQIKLLEQYLGLQLLDRTTTQVRLTHPGAVFLTEARDVLTRADRAVELVREAARGYLGRLVIGNSGGLIMSQVLPAYLATYGGRYPDVKLAMVDLEQTDQLAALENHTIDLGFIPLVAPYTLPAAIGHTVAFSAPVRAMVSEQHPLASEPAVTPEKLGTARIVVLQGATTSLHARNVSTLLARFAVAPNELEFVRGSDSLRAVVASGRAISLMASSHAKPQADGVVFLPIDATPPPTIDLVAIWRRPDDSALVRNFLEVVTAQREPRPAAVP